MRRVFFRGEVERGLQLALAFSCFQDLCSLTVLFPTDPTSQCRGMQASCNYSCDECLCRGFDEIPPDLQDLTCKFCFADVQFRSPCHVSANLPLRSCLANQFFNSPSGDMSNPAVPPDFLFCLKVQALNLFPGDSQFNRHFSCCPSDVFTVLTKTLTTTG